MHLMCFSRLANDLGELEAEIAQILHGNTPTRFPSDRGKVGIFRKPSIEMALPEGFEPSYQP